MADNPIDAVVDAFWKTGAIVLAGLLGISLLAVGVQTVRLGWAQAARDEAIGASAVALSANRTQEAMLTAMTAQRDALLLARAQDAEQAQAAVQQAQAVAIHLKGQLDHAIGQVRRLAALPRCQSVMQAQVCPEIERELRAP